MSNSADDGAPNDIERIQQRAEEVLGDWLYPNAQLRGGGHPQDLTGFCHLQYQTDDSVQQVRAFYWQKIMPQRPVMGGSMYKVSGEKPWFIVRSAWPTGGSWMGMYVTQERSLSIFADTEIQEGNVKLLITWEDH